MLSTGQWTHDYPISAAEAKQLGMPVNTDMSDEVMELMSLYPQPVRHPGGGVEYLPLPRQKQTGQSPPERSDWVVCHERAVASIGGAQLYDAE
jgi:hypothetical protein